MLVLGTIAFVYVDRTHTRGPAGYTNPGSVQHAHLKADDDTVPLLASSSSIHLPPSSSLTNMWWQQGLSTRHFHFFKRMRSNKGGTNAYEK